MTDVIDDEGFRANVGIVLLNHENRVFLGRRSGGRGWQFPQGGMREGEDFERALLRELKEEVGLEPDDVVIEARTTEWLRYRLPARYVRRRHLPLCIGQKQRWFLLRLSSADPAFRFDSTDEPEFDQWRWAEWWEPVREVIAFKRGVYREALHELGAAAFPAGLPAYPEWWEGLASPRM